jgi:hypothetical protein
MKKAIKNWSYRFIRQTNNWLFSIAVTDWWYRTVNGKKIPVYFYLTPIKRIDWVGFYMVILFFAIGIARRR